MWEVVAAVWGVAVVVAVVVLGFAGHELAWKSARLRRDAHELQARRAELARIETDLAQAQERVAAAQQVLGARHRGSRLERAARTRTPLATTGTS